jgi:phosphate transport system substrate-binding protein
MPATALFPFRGRPVRRNVAVWLAGLGLLTTLSAQAAEELRIGGTGTSLGAMQRLGQAFSASRPDAHVTVLPSMGSGGGIKAVIAGQIQIGLSSRTLSSKELAAGATATEYGRTPFVFATADQRPIHGVTSAQLVGFYAGQVEQWPDGARVRLVMRPAGDADSEIVKSLSPAMAQAKELAEQRKGMAVAVTDQEAADYIEKIPGAVGTTTLAQIITEQRPLRALTLDGIVPDIRSIADGRYPLYKVLYLVTGPRATPASDAFIGFVHSPAGRDILRQTGHWIR